MPAERELCPSKRPHTMLCLQRALLPLPHSCKDLVVACAGDISDPGAPVHGARWASGGIGQSCGSVQTRSYAFVKDSSCKHFCRLNCAPGAGASLLKGWGGGDGCTRGRRGGRGPPHAGHAGAGRAAGAARRGSIRGRAVRVGARTRQALQRRPAGVTCLSAKQGVHWQTLSGAARCRHFCTATRVSVCFDPPACAGGA